MTPDSTASTPRLQPSGPEPDLEGRLRRFEDERDITDVLTRYAFYADMGDHDGFVNLFTEDAVIELIGGTPSGAHGDNPSWSGHAEIRDYIDDPTMHMKIEGRCMHLPAINLRIEIDGDEARCRSYSLVLLADPEPTHIYGAGFTDWLMVRHERSWLIKQRVRVAIGALHRSSST
jgi:hypothetical protein